MKQTIICLLVLIFSIPMYCLEFQFQQDVDFGNKSNSSLAIHDNYLINRKRGTLDFYEIQNDGSLNLIQRTQSCMNKPLQTYGDALYTVDNHATKSELKVHQITVDGLIETQRKEIPVAINDLTVTTNYIFAKETNSQNCLVMDRETLEEVGFLNTGYLYYIEDSILVMVVMNVSQNLSAVSVFDISDPNNPQSISYNSIGELSYFAEFYKSDNYLFIGRESDIIILNVSNWNLPLVETTITIDEGSVILDMTIAEDKLMAISSQNHTLWLYDINDIHNPVLLNSNNSLWGNYVFMDADLTSINGHFYAAPAIYINENNHGLSHFKSSDFPDLIISDLYPNLGSMSIYEQTNNHIIYTRGDSLRCITTNEPSSILSVGLPSNGLEAAVHDSIICTYTSNSTTAYIYELSNNSLDQISQTNITDNIKQLRWLNPFWIAAKQTLVNPGLTIMDLVDNQFEIQATISISEAVSIIEQPSDLPYFIFQSCNSDNIHLYFYDKNLPFNLVGSYSSQIGGVNFQALVLDENHMVLTELETNVNPAPKNLYLCTYDSQGFSIIDQTTCNGPVNTLIYRNGYIVTSLSANDNRTQFFQWDNDQLINCGETELECQWNLDIFFYPDMEKAFVCGRYGVQEYTYAVTSVPSSIVPGVVSLSNYPNPFNPNTEIRFQIFDSSLIQSATIEIYNLRGQKVRKLPLTKDELSSGSIHWNGKNFTNQSVTSGIYLYQLKVDGISLAQQKMTIIK